MNPSENQRPENNSIGCLYLIPASLGGEVLDFQIPPGNTRIINQLDEFIVENERTARRFLKKAGFDGNFDLVTFHILDKHTPDHIVPVFLKNALIGKSIGLLSEAGYPCIADPGQKVVKFAHSKGIKVIPLVGPSSILMALVSSGFNGQNFVFHGYLPIEKKDRIRAIKTIESDALKKNQTQIFMETPYRNNALLGDILTNCSDNTQLCIASNITCEDEYIKTMSIAQWKKNTPDLHKKPGIFLIYRE
jgi:16S rRNA (cytidine1402-2'-O)-methyltransferase